MPGHKGCLMPPLDTAAPYDVTELAQTGSLWRGEGPICRVEDDFSAFYNSGASLLSTGGSTLCIQGMLALFCRRGTQVIMGRNCHVAAVHAASLLGLTPLWLWPDAPSGVGCFGRITPAALQAALDANKTVSAVYITSPDYFGVLQDVGALAAVCRSENVPLLVDNAHGAHLVFFKNLHPLAQGADACCDSLHKTLPALTGTALLHLREKALKKSARTMMAVFGSTSPSYLLMLSADMLADGMQDLTTPLQTLAAGVSCLRDKAKERGVWAATGVTDPLRITLLFSGGTRVKALALLKALAIEPEMVTDRHIVLLPSPQNDLSPVNELIEQLTPALETPALPSYDRPVSVLPMHEALFSATRRLPLKKCVGRVAAFPLVSDPPGVALVMPGEVITQNIIENSGGIKHCFVVK